MKKKKKKKKRERELTRLNSSWLTQNYRPLKTMNPSTGLLIREAETSPRIVASYDFGRQRTVDLSGLDQKAVERRVALLVDIGRTMPTVLRDPVATPLYPEVVDARFTPHETASFYRKE